MSAVTVVPDVTEWDEHPPDELAALAGLLDAVHAFVGRFVAFPSPEAHDAVALWTLHAHTLDAAESTPRLAFLSPEPASGKTRALEVLDLLVPNPMHTVNTTSAALFRMVRDKRPTLMLDEADTYLSPKLAKVHGDLQGFVNAGHRRGAVSYRCVGDNPASMHVEEFPAFACVAIAGLGGLPDTVLSRSIVISMKRRAPNERVEPFRLKPARNAAEPLHAQLVTWAAANQQVLAGREPTMPTGVTDRPADVWEALVAIGDLAGDHWSDRARHACQELTKPGDRRESLGELLLADCRKVFADAEHLLSDVLIERLVALEESPWSNLRGRPLDRRGLNRMLGQYDVHPNPTTLRFGERVGRGFTREAFSDAWARYTVTTDTTVTTQAPSGADVTAVTLVTVDDEESDDGARVSVSDVTELAASLGAEHDRARNRAGDGLEDAGGW